MLPAGEELAAATAMQKEWDNGLSLDWSAASFDTERRQPERDDSSN